MTSKSQGRQNRPARFTLPTFGVQALACPGALQPEA